MNFTDNKSFCALAWTHVAADPDGSVKLCCVQNEHIRKSDGSIYNLGYDKIDDFYNSDHYKNVRNNMLQGNLIKGCEQCYEKEKAGGLSSRLVYNNTYKDIIADSEVSDFNIKYIDLRFGNLCNLACRSCTPVYSSQLAKEASNNDKIKKYYGIINDEMNNWYNTEIFLENFKNHSANLNQVYITGGEPTLIEKNYELLESLIESGSSKNILLKFNTNLTNINSRLLNLLPNFKHVLFFISVDGYKKIQEYLRYPSSWDQIDKNIKKLCNFYKPEILFTPSPVIQAMNLNNITDLFEYFESFNRINNKPIFHIDPIILFNPDFSSFLYLPIDYKKKCWQKIEQWIKNNCKFQHNRFFSRMKEIENLCHMEYPIDDKPKKFLEFSTIFDENRNQKLEDYNPELYEIMTKLAK